MASTEDRTIVPGIWSDVFIGRNTLDPRLRVESTAKGSEGKSELTTLFGDRLVATRDDDISVQFQYSVSENDIASAVTGTGVILQVPGRISVSTGAGVGTAAAVSLDSVRSKSGHESQVGFDAAFTLGEVGTAQRIGLVNGNDGYYIGVKGLEFGAFYKGNGVETFIPQSAFNVDNLDGTGNSGFDLDYTKVNLFRMSFNGGITAVYYSIYAAQQGWVLYHVEGSLNLAEPRIRNTKLPVTISTERTTGSGAVVIKSAGFYGGSVGEAVETNSSNRFFVNLISTTIPGGSVATPMVSIRSKTAYQGIVNHVLSKLATFTMASDGTKPVIVRVIKNGILVGASFADQDTADSVVEIDTAATSISGGALLGGTILGKVDRSRINLLVGDVTLKIRPGDLITFTAESKNTNDVDLIIRHKEEF